MKFPLIVPVAGEAKNAVVRRQLTEIETYLNATGNLTIAGVTDGSAATAGNVGEYMSSTGSAVAAAATGVFVNICSASFTAGDWDISGIVALTTSTGTGPNNLALSAFSANTTTDHVVGDNVGYLPAVAAFTVGGAVPAWRVSISSTTTIYLKGLVTYAAGSPTWYGRISGRRVR